DLKRRGIVIETPFEKSRIGDGATAEVYKGKEAGERVVAVKVYVDPDGSHQHERTGRTVPMENYFLNERSMLIGLRESSHVPTYYQSVDNQTKYVDQRIQPYHVMEYVDAMGIGDYARKHLVPDRDHDTALGLFEQLLHAVNDLHTHGEGYLHRDLSGNNAVVDRRGNVRLLDLATGSERSAEHTRVVTVGGETPGYGTDAPVSEEKKTHRKCIADDVHSTCVIGYELFTGHAKEEGQSDVDRRSLLSKEGVHVGIANILMRGMQPVNREIEYDQRRFNDCREVLQAIYEHRESIRRLAASRRVRAQWLWFVCASTVVLALFGLLGYAFYLRYRDARYSALTQQFLEGRAELAEYSDEDQTDPRVQNAVRSAESAYDESQSQFNSGEIDLAVAAILRGNASMSRAGKIADRLQQIRPIVMPVGELLSGDYTQWNTRCDIVRDQYDAFSKQYTLVMNLLDPDASESNAGSAAIDTTQKLAREVPKLQAMQVRLVRDDKLSREIGDRYDHFDTSISVLAPSLRQHHEFKQITGRRQTSYERYYQQGRWEDARVAIRSHELAVNAFIKRHETTEQKQQRLSAGAETIAKQIAENESLQKEAKRLAQQIETLTNDKRDLMAQVGGERVRYENVSQQLQTTTARLQTATTDLAGVRQSLQTTRDERDTLVAYKSDIDEKHAALKQRLQSIEAANEQLSGSLAMTRRELASARDTLKGLQESSGASAAEVRLAQSLRRAITDARKYQPKDWDDANEKLVAASRRYRDLQIKDLAETKLGKTRRHADRKALAQQMDATFKIAITALKKRDEVDVASDGALQSQIRVQQAERKLKTEGEGWAETARIVVAIDR
ncbi:MAG: protein kinase, partial [Planctomycetota bacterium]